MKTSLKVALVALGVCSASISSLWAQCSQDITATYSDPHKTEIVLHFQATGTCPSGSHVRLFLSIDGGGFTEVQDCNVSPGQLCTHDTQGAVECAATQGEHRADVFAICSNPGPNNSCVEASGGKPVFWTVARTVSMAASPVGAPYFIGNSKVCNFLGQADWTSASYLQLLW